MGDPAPAASRQDGHPLSRLFCIALPVLLLATVALLGITRITDGDVWWHLKSGEYFVQHRSFPDRDPFVFTAGQHLIIREWLAQVLFYFVYRTGSFAGLTLFKAALFTVAVGLLWRLGSALRCPAPAAALVLLLAALVARPRLVERPEVPSFVLLAVALLVLLQWAGAAPGAGAGRRRTWWAPYLLVPLQILWANLHSSFYIGLLLPWPFPIDEAARRLRGGGRQGMGEGRAPWPHLLLAALVLWPASALSPQGLRVLLYPLHLPRMPAVWEIDELHGLVAILRVCTGCLEEGIAFLVLALGTLALCAYRGRAGGRVGPGTWLLAIGAAVVPLLVYRFLPYAGLVLAAVALRELGDRRDPVPGVSRGASHAVGGPGATPGVAALLLAVAVFMGVRGSRFPFGLGVATDIFPQGAATFILRADAQGPLLNSFELGSYLLWALFPKRQVFIHTDVWHSVSDDRFIARFFRSARDPATFEALVAEYGIELLVLENRLPSWRFVAADPRWALTYWDQVASVYARRGGANAPLIATREFRVTRYSEDLRYLWDVARDPERFSIGVGELRRAVREEPQNRATRVSLAFLLLARGQELEEALPHVQVAQRLGQRSARVLSLKAGILLGMGRAAEAEAVAREPIRIEPGAWGARLLLADLRARAGDREDAARHLRELLGRGDLLPELRQEAETRLRALTP